MTAPGTGAAYASAVSEWAEGKFSWVLPCIVASGIGTVVGLLLAPVSIHTLQTHPPLGLSADMLEPVIPTLLTMLQGSAILSPAFWALKIFSLAWLLAATLKVIGIPARFLGLFNLLAACSLIQAMETIAGYLIIRAGGPGLNSLSQLDPSAGFDLLLPAGTNALLAGTLNFFSIFEIAYLAALTIGLSYLTGCSRGKAFAVVTVVWLPSLLMAWALAAAG